MFCLLRPWCLLENTTHKIFVSITSILSVDTRGLKRTMWMDFLLWMKLSILSGGKWLTTLGFEPRNLGMRSVGVSTSQLRWSLILVRLDKNYFREKTIMYYFLWLLQEVQILKALVLGEEERGQSQYQVMCFVCHIHKEEFISSDAMAKLRQVSHEYLLFINKFLKLFNQRRISHQQSLIIP